MEDPEVVFKSDSSNGCSSYSIDEEIFQDEIKRKKNVPPENSVPKSELEGTTLQDKYFTSGLIIEEMERDHIRTKQTATVEYVKNEERNIGAGIKSIDDITHVSEKNACMSEETQEHKDENTNGM